MLLYLKILSLFSMSLSKNFDLFWGINREVSVGGVCDWSGSVVVVVGCDGTADVTGTWD